MCKNMSYSMTKYPNLLNHQSAEVAGMEVHQFFPLVKVKCSSALREFLCRVYAPECDPNDPDRTILPPYSLCQEARNGCDPLMNKFGFYWPESLTCEQFYETTTTTTIPTTVSRLSSPDDVLLFDLGVQYTTRPITFESCCTVYTYPAKKFILSEDASVKTGDLRLQPEITWRNGKKPKNGYFTLVVITSDKDITRKESVITNWLLTNKPARGEGDWTTVREYQGPLTSDQDDTVHYLLFHHDGVVNVSALKKDFREDKTQERYNLVSLIADNDMKLVARRRTHIYVDEYTRFKSSLPDSQKCQYVEGYTDMCTKQPKRHFLLRK